MSNLSSSLLLSAFALETAAAVSKGAAADAIKAKGLWPVAAAAADEGSPADVAAAMTEAAAAVREIIAAAVAANAAAYLIEGVSFPVGKDKTGAVKPVSKQAAYARFSDMAGMFAAAAALPPAYAAGIFRANTEAAPILGERAFKVALATARENAALASLSPIRRQWKEFEAAEAAAVAAAAEVEKAVAAVAAAEAAAAAARAKALDIEAVVMAAEAAAAASIQSNGRYNPKAIAEAQAAAASAQEEAAAAVARAEAAEAAAAANIAAAADKAKAKKASKEAAAA